MLHVMFGDLEPENDLDEAIVDRSGGGWICVGKRTESEAEMNGLSSGREG